MELEGTVGVVTGGGTGIGRATALALARAGARAVTLDYAHSATEAEATAADLRDLGCSSIAVRADVAGAHEVRGLADRVLSEFGAVDVLVNNAGTTQVVAHADLAGLSDEIWHGIMDVNVLGALHCAQAFGPALTESQGAIVNIASISGLRAGGSSIAYGVSKAAMLQLTRNLAVALAPRVRVNAVVPGTVATRWQIGLHGEVGFEQMARQERSRVPLDRTSKPEHVAQAVIGLLGMEMVTGEAVIVDGGKHITY